MSYARIDRHRVVCLSALLVALGGCSPKAEEIGALPEGGSGGADAGDGTSDGPGNGESGGESGVEGGSTGAEPEANSCADASAPWCCHDVDADGVPFSTDNAPFHTNPFQGDIDGDEVADGIDLCPTIAAPTNTADSDNDSIGNACDRCDRTADKYNEGFGDTVAAYMRVRNIPTNADSDGDGIGDACDNCPQTANCLNYDSDNPHLIGDPIPDVDDAACQRDEDGDGVGDACQGAQGPLAAGPVGLGPDDDFDQDGLTNIEDGCPRLPLAETVDCSDNPGACPDDSECTDGVCNHIDRDADGVGDRCDTCALSPNPGQYVEAADDDDDGDFIGKQCELGAECISRSSARPVAYAVAAEDSCCVQLLLPDDATGDLYLAATCPSADALPTDCTRLLAPDPELPGNLLPVREGSQCPAELQEAGECLPLPANVATTPGILTPPPGCDAALANAGMTPLQNLVASAQDLAAVIADGVPQCRMPATDEDFDGHGSVCDRCPVAHDPSDAVFIDDNGTVWENNGAFCNGDYAPSCE